MVQATITTTTYDLSSAPTIPLTTQEMTDTNLHSKRPF